LLLALAGPACTDEIPAGSSADAGATGDAKADQGAGDGAVDVPVGASAPVFDCFSGVPRTHEELLNACWPETVTAIERKVKLPPGYKSGAPLPTPPGP